MLAWKGLLMDVQFERVEARMTPYDLSEEQLEELRCHLLTSRKSVENVEGLGSIEFICGSSNSEVPIRALQ